MNERLYSRSEAYKEPKDFFHESLRKGSILRPSVCWMEVVCDLRLCSFPAFLLGVLTHAYVFGRVKMESGFPLKYWSLAKKRTSFFPRKFNRKKKNFVGIREWNVCSALRLYLSRLDKKLVQSRSRQSLCVKTSHSMPFIYIPIPHLYVKSIVSNKYK